MATALVRMLPRIAVVALFLVFGYGLVYRPLGFGSLNGRARPDMSWLLAQQDIRQVVPNGTLLLNPKFPCPKFLAVVVCSAVGNFAARRAIRETWGRDAMSTLTRAFFLLGRTDNETLQEEVNQEAGIYGDVLQADFMDTYNNLTVKSVVLLQWASKHCSETKYILKTDDDMYVNVPNLVHYLHKKGTPKMLLGCLISGATPVRDWSSKWYVPLIVYPQHTYPDYLSGTGYVLSGDILSQLFRTALETPFFYMEDIFITGMVASKLGLKPVNSDAFKFYKRKNNPCVFRQLITAHLMTPQELRAMWGKVHNRKIKCS